MNHLPSATTFGLAGAASMLAGLAALPLLAWPLPAAAIGAGAMLCALAAPFVPGPPTS